MRPVRERPCAHSWLLLGISLVIGNIMCTSFRGCNEYNGAHNLLWAFNFLGMVFGGVVRIAIKMGTMSQCEEKAVELENDLKKTKLKSKQAKHQMLP